MSKRNIKCVFL